MISCPSCFTPIADLNAAPHVCPKTNQFSFTYMPPIPGKAESIAMDLIKERIKHGIGITDDFLNDVFKTAKKLAEEFNNGF